MYSYGRDAYSLPIMYPITGKRMGEEERDENLVTSGLTLLTTSPQRSTYLPFVAQHVVVVADIPTLSIDPLPLRKVSEEAKEHKCLDSTSGGGMDKISVNAYLSAFQSSQACTGSGGFEFLRFGYEAKREHEWLDCEFYQW